MICRVWKLSIALILLYMYATVVNAQISQPPANHTLEELQRQIAVNESLA